MAEPKTAPRAARTRKSKRLILAAGALAIAISPVGESSAQNDPPEVPDDDARGLERSDVERTYVVVMDDEPAITYSGGTAGIPATRPARDDRLDPDDADVRNYRAFLRSRQDLALRRAGIPHDRKLHQYTVAVNGMAIRATSAQATNLLAQPGVVSIVEDELNQLVTTTTPDFLGLTDDGGAWDQGFVGDDVVIGVVDSGIWPQSASFCDTVDADGRPLANARRCANSRNVVYDPPSDWHGECQTGERFGRNACNNKLVGARYYNQGWGGNAGIKQQLPYEFNSPRDYDGHGTHTASTAGGNAGVSAVIDGEVLGTASGMAPRAHIAAYKACWGVPGEGGCWTSDTVAAIDDAVADGVDVINYSISGTETNFLDPVEIAFFNASAAGVFIAASAGNTGPAAGTVNHPSPWITTVAASTHDRLSQGQVILGDDQVLTGKTWQTTGTGELPLVYAGDVAVDGVDPGDAAMCFVGSLDPELVGGAMVLCDRGVTARVEKSQVVADAGGAAMVLANVEPDTVNLDTHAVPTVHLDHLARGPILDYILTDEAPTARLTPREDIADPTAPQASIFSARGPSAATGDLLKPDITAPGVDVIAAVAPPGNDGRNFDVASGTSMSSPHIAGLAAVMTSAHPDWSPAAIKSAMMTTASDVEGARPFAAGSGHVRINAALDPGLVYDANSADYIGFLCGTGQYVNPPQCEDLGIEPSDLNQPNIAVAALAGHQAVTRRVTNTGSEVSAYEPVVDAPDGINIELSHDALLLEPGQTTSYEVTVHRDDAPLGEWAFGSLTWGDGTNEVTSTIAVQPVALAAPDEVTHRAADEAGSVEVGFGYTGDYRATAHGLVAATTQEDVVDDDPSRDINTALQTGVGVTFHEIDVPVGSSFARFALFDDYTDGNDDLDLYVFDPALSFVGSSGNPASDEIVDLTNPTPGAYTVVVHGWQTDGPDAGYTLFAWALPENPDADDGSLVITGAPEAAETATTAVVEYGWGELEPGTKYLGALDHHEGPELLARTLVAVNTD